MTDELFDELTNIVLVKKKKKDKKHLKNVSETIVSESSVNVSDTKELVPSYTYSELLDRLYKEQMLNEYGTNEYEKKRFYLPEPIVEKMSRNRSLWCNVNQISVSLNRPINHICKFVLYELNTQGTMNNNQFIIKGNHYSKNIKNVLTKYVVQFIQCHVCRSHSTIVETDRIARTHILRCNDCKCSRIISEYKQ